MRWVVAAVLVNALVGVDTLLAADPVIGPWKTVDEKSGKVVWRSAGDTEGAHYSSPVVAELGGVKQIVQMASSSVGPRPGAGTSLQCGGRPAVGATSPNAGWLTCGLPLPRGRGRPKRSRNSRAPAISSPCRRTPAPRTG